MNLEAIKDGVKGWAVWDTDEKEWEKCNPISAYYLTQEEARKWAHARTLYLDYVNNFLTIEAFAEYYSLTKDEAGKIIKEGRL